jgi:hypothetical protein
MFIINNNNNKKKFHQRRLSQSLPQPTATPIIAASKIHQRKDHHISPQVHTNIQHSHSTSTTDRQHQQQQISGC